MENDGVAEQIKASYRSHSHRYRQDDEIEVSTPAHQRLRARLEEISRSFAAPIRVLDLGCGTGRYFYCLKNVDTLVGMDLSPEMLQLAEHPVRAEAITAKHIELQCGNVFEVTFAPESFDFIYSLGMFGYGCPMTAELGVRFYEWLRPGGQVFFDILDTAGVHRSFRLKRQLRRWVPALLPRSLRRHLEERKSGPPLYDMTAHDLQKVMRQTPFQQFQISSATYTSPVWRTIKLECLASKPGRETSMPAAALPTRAQMR